MDGLLSTKNDERKELEEKVKTLENKSTHLANNIASKKDEIAELDQQIKT
jgi:predicted  nucleic acid-binding Zn-ribbon protein